MRDKVMFIGKVFFHSLIKGLLSQAKLILCVLIYSICGVCLIANKAFSQGLPLNKTAAESLATEASKMPIGLRAELQSGLFWKEPQHQDQMAQKRILVSVLHKEHYWSFKGAGFVQAPRDFIRSKLLEFNRLSEASDRFQTVEFDAKESRLSFQFQFLGKSYPMEFLLSEVNLANSYHLYFQSSAKSAVTGIEARLELLDAKRHVELSLISIAPKIPGFGPDWFLSLITEGVMHHIAEHLRKSIESSYILSQKK